MKANRRAFLGLLVCLSSAVATAQMAPSNKGDIGLFTMPSADTPAAGSLFGGLYGWKEQLVAGNLAFTDTQDRSRLFSHWVGAGSIGLGLTNGWDFYMSFGEQRFESRGGWTGGAVNSISFPTHFESNEPTKLWFGTKVRLVSELDSNLRVGLFLAAGVPVGHANVHVDEQVADVTSVESRRADWLWGGVITKGIFSGMVSYQLSGKHDNDIRPANQFRVAAGVDVPVLPFLHVIGELDRTMPDGGDLPPDSWSMIYAGARFYFGRSGWAVSGAVNANADQLFKHGFSPSPVGGLVGITYAAWPPQPPPPVVVPPPAPAAAAVEEKTEAEVAVAPAPPPTAPPPPTPRTTRDEISFDAGSARLTNIAKAILDGVALRMKNDLNSTAVITGYSDNAGSEQANTAISAKRADAAKEYLVTRHGIDPNRITTAAKGSAEPAYDNATAEGRAKNRRAVILVTLVSGS
ncbi:MAG TPA: OmpA family protein [Thermoanaerobaculia bacterium]|nr:OmpA family protein [Thermoanaerobaculia bacterium]